MTTPTSPADLGLNQRPGEFSKRSKTLISYRDIAVFALYAMLTLSWTAPFFGELLQPEILNAMRQCGYLMVFALALLSSQTFSRPHRLLDVPVTVMLALGFCWLSVMWSFDPANSLRKLFLTTIVLISTFLLVREIGYQDAVRIMRRNLTTLILISFVVVVVSPGLAVHQISEVTADDLIGNWKGVFGHKNIAGPAASFLILTLVLAPMGMQFWTRIAIISATAFFLYKTGSKTAFGLVGLCAFFGLLIGRDQTRFRAIPVAIFLIVFFSVTAYVWANWAQFSAPFLEDEALTGRGAIWSVLIAFSQDHHLGAGYGSFWNIDGLQPIDSYTRPRSWVAELGSSHNGYLELLVTVGPIGLILAVAAFALSPLVRILSSIYLPGPRRGYLAAMILYALTANFTETTLLDRDQPVYVMLLLSIALIAVAMQMPRHRGGHSYRTVLNERTILPLSSR
jgi:hypothetical protein